MTDNSPQKLSLQGLQEKLEPLGYTIVRKDDENRLFMGDDEMFKGLFDGVTLYGEYGVGQSTKWVFRNTDAQIIAVDTDQRWVQSVQLECRSDARLNIKYCDVGRIGSYGRPIDYSNRDQFGEYTNAWWLGKQRPEVVLVDGRFRVCCFLTCLKYAVPGTRIVFDDYADRPIYHIVEEFLQPVQKCGRQVLFVTDGIENLDMEHLDRTIDRFQFVMD